MADDNTPHPVDQAVKALADIHADTMRHVPRSQRGIERLIGSIGRPWFAYALVSFVALWIAIDLLAGRFAHRFDPQTFPWLELIVSTMSLMMAALILISENRQGRLADQREQVTLQMALVIDRKAAKIVELLDRCVKTTRRFRIETTRKPNIWHKRPICVRRLTGSNARRRGWSRRRPRSKRRARLGAFGRRIDRFANFGDNGCRKSADLGVLANHRFVGREIDAKRLVAGDVTFDPLNIGCELGERRIGLTGRFAQLFPLERADARDVALDDKTP